MPACTFAAYWLGGTVALLTLALGLPIGLLVARVLRSDVASAQIPRDSVTGLVLRHGFLPVLRDTYHRTRDGALKSACFLIEIDDLSELRKRHGQAVIDDILQRTADRLQSALRSGDCLARLSETRLAICLMPVRQLDLELCLQLATRLQKSVEEPIRTDGLTLYLSCSVGFCLRSRAPGSDERAWLDAAVAALDDAAGSGPGAVRSFTAEMQSRGEVRAHLQRDIRQALENGEIRPWFQPQVSTDTGRVSGFEALARWVHPVRGIVPPDQFLPAIEAMGLLDRLTMVILREALDALRQWDEAGRHVPRIAINLTSQDLADPRLCEKIGWHLDCAGLTADRLCIEILETVVAESPDDSIVRTIRRLHDMGCAIDLDDYGTGHASIAALRRFPVSRIKIDRSFVMKADRDPEQQRLVGAILTMAERLDLDTLAEGVETAGEHALLAQLGCAHVQGFGIARPMPFKDTLAWLARHDARVETAPQIGRRPG